jgi:hypothetical protein
MTSRDAAWRLLAMLGFVALFGLLLFAAIGIPQ